MRHDVPSYEFYPRPQQFEQQPQFLTDREAAEATAITFLGPLAALAFEREPTTSIAAETVYYETASGSDVEIQGSQLEATTLDPEIVAPSQHREHLAQAAVMFAMERDDFELAA